MSNQDSSLKPPASPGSITPSPILEATWLELMKVNEAAGTQPPPHLQEFMRYAYMQGATVVYNTMITAIRSDSTLVNMAEVSKILMDEINAYFALTLTSIRNATPQ